jgi:flagellar L-ring protein FlgH
MNRNTSIATTALLCLITCSQCTWAGSIWAKRSHTARVMFTDDVARNIGDIITIFISEDSKTDNKAKRDLSKATDRSGSLFGITEGIGSNLLPDFPNFDVDVSNTNDLKSKADFKDEKTFTDKITVTVIDILPNRNLVVSGTRNRTIAGDIQTLEVSGIIRPSDVAFDNTVMSQKVANFRLVSKSGGVSASYTKPGWFGRILDTVWPF